MIMVPENYKRYQMEHSSSNSRMLHKASDSVGSQRLGGKHAASTNSIGNGIKHASQVF